MTLKWHWALQCHLKVPHVFYVLRASPPESRISLFHFYAEPPSNWTLITFNDPKMLKLPHIIRATSVPCSQISISKFYEYFSFSVTWDHMGAKLQKRYSYSLKLSNLTQTL